jgi:hypothetical protein
VVYRWFKDKKGTGTIALEKGGYLVVALGRTQQYFRQNYMPSRHVQSRI